MRGTTARNLDAGLCGKSSEEVPAATPRARTGLLSIVGFLLMVLTSEARSQVQYETGVASIASRPTIVNLDSLPTSAGLPAIERPVRPHPSLKGLSEDEYRTMKERAAIPDRVPAAPLPLPAKPGAGAALPFPAFNGNKASVCMGFIPPDMALAVGDDNSEYPVIQITNSCIGLFSKDGRAKSGYPKLLSGLLGKDNTYPYFAPFDPRALYDWVSRRYIIVATNHMGEYLLAVSRQNSSSGDYYVYKIPMPSGTQNAAFADFPRLGQDREHIYIASNKGIDGKFQYEEWLLLPKSKLYEGSTFDFGFLFNPRFNGIAMSSSQPSNVWNPSDQMRSVFVSSKNYKPGGGLWCVDAKEGCKEIFVWSAGQSSSKWLWPVAGAKVFHTTNIYSQPPDAQQKDREKIWSNNTDIVGQVTYANYSLVAALNTRNTSGGASSLLVKIGELYPSGGIDHARITDEAMLDYGKDVSAIFATPVPDLKGNTITVFSFIGGQHNAAAAVILRRDGKFGDPVVVREGTGQYRSARWGDYTAVAPGLPQHTGEPSQMWFSGMNGGGATNNHPDWFTVFGNAAPLLTRPQDVERVTGR